MTTRHVVTDGGRQLVQYRLPLSARRNQQARKALEREAGAALAIERAYGTEPYARLFTRFVGHNLDAAEPFVLYSTAAPGSAPLTRSAGRLGVQQLRTVMTQLMLVARLLEHVGFVPPGPDPAERVVGREEGGSREPSGAIPVGTPREPYGEAPWATLEQRRGTGAADPRDDVWSVAHLSYLLAGGSDGGAGPPPDLDGYSQLAALRQSGAFETAAVQRPYAADVLRLLGRPDPLADVARSAADPLDAYREEHEQLLASKRRDLGAVRDDGFGAEPRDGDPSGRPATRNGWSVWRGLTARKGGERWGDGDLTGSAPHTVICPYCLDPLTYDETRLYARNTRQEYEALDLADEYNPVRREDMLRSAFQRCPHSGGMEPHYLPVPYLTSGPPLTIAMVGSSSTGKTHLLGSLIGEVERGGLEPYGLTCRPLNPEWHSRFVRERVQPLHEGQVLARTTTAKFAFFADALLVSGHGTTRPVMFFDLAGEDLVEHGEVTRFLAGVGAFVFVVDPLRALRIPYLDEERGNAKVPERSLGDESFATVLSRVPDSHRRSRYIHVPAAVAVSKSDLVRFEQPVDRWLRQPLTADLTDRELRAESKDVYAFLRHYGSKAWLRPFAECARCTLHFVSATGGRQQDNVFPNGVTPHRVLAPLLSIFAMSGLLPDDNLNETGL